MCAFVLAQLPQGSAVDWPKVAARLSSRKAPTWTHKSNGSWHLMTDTPMLEHGGLWFGGDLRLDNLAELSQALKLTSEREPLMLLRAAWLRWGERLADQLIGDFALFVASPELNRVYAARDVLGVRQVYYHHSRERFALASAASALAALPGLGDQVNRQGLWMWLQNDYEERTTMFEGVTGLGTAESLSYLAGRVQVAAYWHPGRIALWHPKDPSEYAAAFRETLARTTADRCRQSRGVVGTTLSGGLDSSSVTAMAQRACRESGHQLLPFSFRFPRDPVADESAQIQETCRFLGLRPHWLEADELEFMAGELAGGAHHETPMIGFGAWFHTLLSQLVEADGDVLLTGHGGDNMLTGINERDLLIGRAQRGDRSAKAVLKSDYGFRQTSIWWRCHLAAKLPQCLVRWLRPFPVPAMPAWVPTTNRAEWAAVAKALSERPRVFEEHDRQTAFEFMTFHTAGVRRAIHTLEWQGQHHGVQVLHPFMDRRVLELFLSIPPEFVRPGPLSKQFCRESMTGFLPELVLGGLSKPRLGGYYHRGVKSQAKTMRTLMEKSNLADLNMVESGPWLSACEAYLLEDPNQAVADFLPAIMVENWLWQRRLLLGVQA